MLVMVVAYAAFILSTQQLYFLKFIFVILSDKRKFPFQISLFILGDTTFGQFLVYYYTSFKALVALFFFHRPQATFRKRSTINHFTTNWFAYFSLRVNLCEIPSKTETLLSNLFSKYYNVTEFLQLFSNTLLIRKYKLLI